MALSNIIPLIILLVVVAILAFVGYIAYSIVQDVSRNTREKMENKHLMFTKDGMTVGVKELKDEDYKDRSQSVLVNMWNHTSFPAYKSRLWNMTGSSDEQEVERRKTYSK
ncbi:hypothetical protein AWENTII_001125 [Aspergillus wentii]|nr:hypothetical protein MW887_001580 [Aspergillus wentii]